MKTIIMSCRRPALYYYFILCRLYQIDWCKSHYMPLPRSQCEVMEAEMDNLMTLILNLVNNVSIATFALCRAHVPHFARSALSTVQIL